jgi:hypothetical protein
LGGGFAEGSLKYYEKKSIGFCLLLSISTFSSSVWASDAAKLPSFDKQQRLRAFVEKYKEDHQQKKFTAAAAFIRGSFTDKSSVTLLKGHNKAGVIAFGYQFTPKFSANAVFVKSRTTERTSDEKLKVISHDDTILASYDYSILEWLKLDFSFSSKQGKSITTDAGKANVDSVSKNVYRTPSLYLKMTFPTNQQFFIAPDVGISRTFMHNRAYVDNSGDSIAKRDMHLDQVAANSKFGYVINSNVIPYVSTGYSRTLHYSDHLKSRNSFRAGAGAILFGGLLNIDWTASKANQSVRANTLSVNLAVKF